MRTKLVNALCILMLIALAEGHRISRSVTTESGLSRLLTSIMSDSLIANQHSKVFTDSRPDSRQLSSDKSSPSESSYQVNISPRLLSHAFYQLNKGTFQRHPYNKSPVPNAGSSLESSSHLSDEDSNDYSMVSFNSPTSSFHLDANTPLISFLCQYLSTLKLSSKIDVSVEGNSPDLKASWLLFPFKELLGCRTRRDVGKRNIADVTLAEKKFVEKPTVEKSAEKLLADDPDSVKTIDSPCD